MNRLLASGVTVLSAVTSLTASAPIVQAPQVVRAVTTVTCTTPTVVAHRGGTETYDENTRRAFRWATDVAGAKWWETDVRFDKMNTPFIMHDATLDRTTNWSGPVTSYDLYAARTKGLRTNDGQYVPTLYEVLSDAAARPGVQVQVELKVRPTAAQLTAFIARFDWLNMRSRAVITSFDAATLTDVKQAAGNVRRALLANTGDVAPSTILPYATIYSKTYVSITRDRLTRWTAAGITVDAWTPDTLVEWERMAHYGGMVSQVITNKPYAYRHATLC